MRLIHVLLPALLACGSSLAQDGPAAASPVPRDDVRMLQEAAAPANPRERAIQHIEVEDGATRIDELRYGGETQSITVSPRSGARPYQIVPRDGASNFPGALGAAAGAAGQRVWNILDF